jgi:fatty-acyl-CoA synthase
VLCDSIAYFARARPHKLACVELATGEKLSYAQLELRCARMAYALDRIMGNVGLSGRRVAVLARNSVELLCLHLACRRLGAVFVPLNWRLSGAELGSIVRLAEPVLILVHPDFSALASELHEGAPLARLAGFGPNGELARAMEGSPRGVQVPRRMKGDEIVTLLFTSGTTGRPKGVVITGDNAHASARNYALSVNIDGSSVMLCDMPLFHVVGLFTICGSVLEAGGTLLLSAQFSAEATQKWIADPALGVTHYFCVPQMAQMLRHAKGFDPQPFRRLKALQTGGAPHAAHAIGEWIDDGVRCVDGFGMTEAGTVLGVPPDDFALLRRKAGTVGVPAAHIQVRVVDRKGMDVGVGEVGELWVRGPSVTPGYWRDKLATNSAFRDGWLRTGDAASRDPEGYFTVVDRWKDMYISGGENVYPAEIESVLLEIPGVVEAAVIGISDEKWGETGCAYLVMAADAQFAPDLILMHCRRKLARYKIPKEIQVVDALPRTASGKLKKDLLRKPGPAVAGAPTVAGRRG